MKRVVRYLCSALLCYVLFCSVNASAANIVLPNGVECVGWRLLDFVGGEYYVNDVYKDVIYSLSDDIQTDEDVVLYFEELDPDDVNAVADRIYNGIRNISCDIDSRDGTCVDVPKGYYLLMTNHKDFVMLNSVTNNDLALDVKYDRPDITKSLVDRLAVDGNVRAAFDVTASVDSAIASYDSYRYAIHDKMSKGMSYVRDSLSVVLSDGYIDYDITDQCNVVFGGTSGLDETCDVSIDNLKDVIDGFDFSGSGIWHDSNNKQYVSCSNGVFDVSARLECEWSLSTERVTKNAVSLYYSLDNYSSSDLFSDSCDFSLLLQAPDNVDIVACRWSSDCMESCELRYDVVNHIAMCDLSGVVAGDGVISFDIVARWRDDGVRDVVFDACVILDEGIGLDLSSSHYGRLSSSSSSSSDVAVSSVVTAPDVLVSGWNRFSVTYTAESFSDSRGYSFTPVLFVQGADIDCMSEDSVRLVSGSCSRNANYLTLDGHIFRSTSPSFTVDFDVFLTDVNNSFYVYPGSSSNYYFKSLDMYRHLANVMFDTDFDFKRSPDYMGYFVKVLYDADFTYDLSEDLMSGDNLAQLEYSSKNGVSFTPWKDVTVEAGNLMLKKVDEAGNPLSGVGFTLYRLDEVGYDDVDMRFLSNAERPPADMLAWIGWWSSEEHRCAYVPVLDFMVDSDGFFDLGVLEYGWYALRENVIPDGYEAGDPVFFRVGDDGIHSEMHGACAQDYFDEVAYRNYYGLGSIPDGKVANSEVLHTSVMYDLEYSTVTMYHTVCIVDVDGKYAPGLSKVDSGSYSLVVVNKEEITTILPETGGSGVMFIVVGGVGFIALGVLVLSRRRRNLKSFD